MVDQIETSTSAIDQIELVALEKLAVSELWQALRSKGSCSIDAFSQ
jgi:hypothetical protein